MTCHIKEKIDKLQSELDALKEEYEKQPKKWEPQNGPFCVFSNGRIVQEGGLNFSYKKFGVKRKTRAHAEALRDLLHRVAVIDAYIREHAPDWKVDWDNHAQPKYTVYFDRSKQRWYYTYLTTQQYILPVMPFEVAEQLIADLRYGRVAF